MTERQAIQGKPVDIHVPQSQDYGKLDTEFWGQSYSVFYRTNKDSMQMPLSLTVLGMCPKDTEPEPARASNSNRYHGIRVPDALKETIFNELKKVSGIEKIFFGS